MKERLVAFVVGHESWGKSETLKELRRLSGAGPKNRRFEVGGVKFLVRSTSNDDKPKSYARFMTSTRRKHVIAALCPKFKRLANANNRNKYADETLRKLQRHGYFLCFWVIEHKWHDPTKKVTSEEIRELKKYGRVKVFQGQRVEAHKRAKEFRDFVSKGVAYFCSQ